MTKYLVTDIQHTETTISNPTYAYDTREDAEAKFYALCSGAVKSAVMVHTIMMFTDEGFVLDSKCFKHPTEEPVE